MMTEDLKLKHLLKFVATFGQNTNKPILPPKQLSIY